MSLLRLGSRDVVLTGGSELTPVSARRSLLAAHRAACLIDAFLSTPATIEALSTVLERFFPSASIAEGGDRSWRWRLVQHAPSEQLYLVHPALIEGLSAAFRPAEEEQDPAGQAQGNAYPIIWLDARSTVLAGTRLPRAPSHLAASLETLLQCLRGSEDLICLDAVEAEQDEETQRHNALEGVSLAGLLLEYGGVYSFLGEREGQPDGAQAPSDGRNNLSGELLILFSLSILPPGGQEGLAERSILSFSIPLRALRSDEKEQLVEWARERTRRRIERLSHIDGGEETVSEANKASIDFVQWLKDCTVQVKAREVVLDLVGL